MPDKILSIEDLTLSFDENGKLFHAVDHISLELYRGQSLGIVGESGSGKSLTALSILNILPPAAIVSSGNIFFYQENLSKVDILQASQDYMRNIRGNSISMIFQDPMTSLNPVYTCGDQVIENIREHRSIKKAKAKGQVLELFSDVQLPDPGKIFGSYPHELSGGQQQRVMIAMALSCRPEILIADEPTTALDVTVQRSILNMLNELKDKYQMSLIFISHDLGVVAEVADEIAVMYKGKIVEQEPTKHILKNPQNEYTKGLIACRPSLSKKPYRLLTLDDFKNNYVKTERNKHFISEADEDSNKKPLFQVLDVSKSYPLKRNFFGKITRSNPALKNINLEIYEGETLGLVGESGSGKSTLGRVLLNLVNHQQGEIIYHDKPMHLFNKKDYRNFRQKAQIIFQDPYSSLNPRLSVGEMIGEPLKYYKQTENRQDRKQKVIDLLNDVRLGEEFYYRYPHELSGGQRQRVSIARVLGLNPEFIVCDEAVSALDVSVQAEILNLLQDLKEAYKLTYVFISHDFSVIRFMADRIAVMKNGKIVELAPARHLLDSPKNNYTIKLLNSIPAID